jgi:hypothetical protein
MLLAAAASAAACATELLQKAEGQRYLCTGTGQQNLIYRYNNNIIIIRVIARDIKLLHC